MTVKRAAKQGTTNYPCHWGELSLETGNSHSQPPASVWTEMKGLPLYKKRACKIAVASHNQCVTNQASTSPSPSLSPHTQRIELGCAHSEGPTSCRKSPSAQPCHPVKTDQSKYQLGWKEGLLGVARFDMVWFVGERCRTGHNTLTHSNHGRTQEKIQRAS